MLPLCFIHVIPLCLFEAADFTTPELWILPICHIELPNFIQLSTWQENHLPARDVLRKMLADLFLSCYEMHLICMSTSREAERQL
jgi:hypothetical protein